MEKLKYTDLLRANAGLRSKVANQHPYKVKVLNNVTCNQLNAVLSYYLMRQGVNVQVAFGNYDNVIQDSFEINDEDLVIVQYDLLNIINKLDTYVEELTEESLIELEENLKNELSILLPNLKKVPCVIFNAFSDKSISINQFRVNRLRTLAKHLNDFVTAQKEKNTYLVDCDDILIKVGYDRAFDWKLFNLSKTLYTIDYWNAYVQTILPLLLKVTGHIKKAIIFDCDNTLWSGILGEDGFDGIQMSLQSKVGSIFHQVQQMAVWLSKHGVLVGLCSKNNPEDVENVLKNHPDMVIKPEHIVVSEVNWNDKASNLKTIAEELNIGLDSIVFVDDSSFEVNLIRQQLPQVECLQVPENVDVYPQQLADVINRVFFFTENKADLDKTRQYKQQAERNRSKRQFSDMESYLSSLGITVQFDIDRPEDVVRVAQLTQKTNQFNLCTNRYTETQIENMMADDTKHCCSIRVKDKFGDLGLTGVAILTREDHQMEINDFLLSCRVIGRNVELAVMDQLVKYAESEGCDKIKGKYIPTLKNKQVSDFYDRLGFDPTGDGYLLDVSQYKFNDIKYINITKNDNG